RRRDDRRCAGANHRDLYPGPRRLAGQWYDGGAGADSGHGRPSGGGGRSQSGAKQSRRSVDHSAQGTYTRSVSRDAARHRRRSIGQPECACAGQGYFLRICRGACAMIGRHRYVAPALLALLYFTASSARAEPYLAMQLGLKCSQCHINPTGGGLRTTFGDIFAQTVLPAQHLDSAFDNWTGQVGQYLRSGGDLRFDASLTQVPQTRSVQQFALEQTRVYLEADVIPNRLLAYVDEQVAPGGALNREAYLLYWSATHDWYVKAGQMYLPFGLRLQDQTAFILTATGINMTTPDQGVEFGWEHGRLDAQIAVSNGTAGGAVTGNGKQYSTQLAYVESRWRLGVAANRNDQSIGAKNT